MDSVEISNINVHGVWISIGQTEYFLPFTEYPWFKVANISQILNVQLLHENYLYWPQLDVDLEIDCLENPQHHPLISKI
jgi:hypothetical protein